MDALRNGIIRSVNDDGNDDDDDDDDDDRTGVILLPLEVMNISPLHEYRSERRKEKRKEK
jgi:hypothetical protein